MIRHRQPWLVGLVMLVVAGLAVVAPPVGIVEAGCEQAASCAHLVGEDHHPGVVHDPCLHEGGCGTVASSAAGFAVAAMSTVVLLSPRRLRRPAPGSSRQPLADRLADLGIDHPPRLPR